MDHLEVEYTQSLLEAINAYNESVLGYAIYIYIYIYIYLSFSFVLCYTLLLYRVRQVNFLFYMGIFI
jgi:hypothetical protein